MMSVAFPCLRYVPRVPSVTAPQFGQWSLMGDFLVSAHHKANTPRIQPMIPRNVSTDLAPVINATNAVANTGIE